MSEQGELAALREWAQAVAEWLWAENEDEETPSDPRFPKANALRDAGYDDAHDFARSVLQAMHATSRAHDARIRAEALAPVLALFAPGADFEPCNREAGEFCSHGECAAAYSVLAALRTAAGTPTHHTTEEDA